MSSHGSDSTVTGPQDHPPVNGSQGVNNSPCSFAAGPTPAPPLSISALVAPTPPHIHCAMDGGSAASTSSAPPALSLNPQAQYHSRTRSEPDAPLPASVSSPTAPSLRFRTARTLTFRNVDNFSDYEVRPGWRPGAEPGIDTRKPDGGSETLARMKAPSEITVVDFSQSDITTTRLDNNTLAGFLAVPQHPDMKCRWINVNGLSWDVVQILGNHKNLHRLAIEDLLNTRNRTKADWYPSHAFMVLTLQKLVHFDETQPLAVERKDIEDEEDENDGNRSRKSGRGGYSHNGLSQRLRSIIGRKSKNFGGLGAPGTSPSKTLESGLDSRPFPRPKQPEILPELTHVNQFRTLQRYRASPNDARTDFMESHSALRSRNLAVAAEQVSIFIASDNTVISFFELSAQDVEQPILKRLLSSDTSLRRSCDASMIAQAILDAIIDLAIPVTVCYGDVIGDLELDVLTRPNINHTKSLYIAITEMNKVLSFINPVMNLINTLRDHKTDNVGIDDLRNPDKGVVISTTTYVYLADVLDHCVLITEALEQMKGQAENMINLIFNTISAYQNESMKQLTIVTIIFLPLTFLTGYFGQNFQNFTDLERGVHFFWEISGPVIFFTIVIMMREMIINYVKSLIQQRHIISIRKHHRKARTKTTG